MNLEHVTRERKRRRAEQKAASRAAKKRNKGHSNNSRSNSSIEQPIRIPGPSGTVGGRGSVTVLPADTQRMLHFGECLNDNIMQAYLNLLAIAAQKQLGLSVRVVAPQFYPLLMENGWERVRRWVKGHGQWKQTG